MDMDFHISSHQISAHSTGQGTSLELTGFNDPTHFQRQILLGEESYLSFIMADEGASNIKES